MCYIFGRRPIFDVWPPLTPGLSFSLNPFPPVTPGQVCDRPPHTDTHEYAAPLVCVRTERRAIYDRDCIIARFLRPPPPFVHNNNNNSRSISPTRSFTKCT